MNYYSAWPLPLIVGAVVALASCPLFRGADAVATTGGRNFGLDGLRGFLALAVVLHHAAIQHLFLVAGRWSMPSSPLFAMLGPVGVGMFFIITAHLFWSRMLASGGRMDWVPFMIGRVFRIGPVYLVAFAGVAAVVVVAGGPVLKVPVFGLVKEVVRWLLLGAVRVQDLNAYPATPLLLCGVIWTLRYEWWFYLALPVLGVVCRWRRLELPATLAALGAVMVGVAIEGANPVSLRALLLFLIGMATASLQARGWGARLAEGPASVVVVLCLGLALQLDEQHAACLSVCLGVAFYLIASGCSVFGVLHMRGTRRLGNVSYGVYLIHGLVIAALFRPEPMRSLMLVSAAWSWALTVCAVLVTVPLAVGLHVAVELPGIRLGRVVARRVQGALGRGSAALAVKEAG